MKSATRLKYSIIASITFASIVAVSRVHATAYKTDNNGQPVHWPVGTNIAYVVNPNGVGGLTADLQKLIVVGAVDDAFRAWTNIPQASIHFTDAGQTTATGSAGDGVNVVSFQDPGGTALLRPGVLAITNTRSALGPGPVQVGGQVVNAQFAGQILDADITFNSLDQAGAPLIFTPIGGNGADLVAILMHEVGHLLGLDHAAVLSSIMNPFGESGSGTASRTLQSDDAITAAVLYPNPNFSPIPGTISGKISTASTTPVKSAHVVAISTTSGAPVASQLSGTDGGYSIQGLPAGTYQVMVEPLDGPVDLNNFPGFYNSGQFNFATTFFGGGTPATVNVGAGQTASADVTVGPAPAVPMNILLLGNLPAGAPSGAALIEATQYLPRGNSYQMIMAGTLLTSDSVAKLSAPAGDISLQGATSTPNFQAQPGITFRQQNLAVSATAPLGPSNLMLSNSTGTTAMSGGIVVTVNPKLNAALDGAGFNGNLAPGTIFSIFGTDLAFGNGDGNSDAAAATPLPTELGGVNVKVGNRYAPLFYVSPTQINAMIPFETTGTSTTLNIETGPGAEGKGIQINLSPTAPGIFSTGGGVGQAVILNGSDNTLAAPAGAFPGSHPAKANDVVIIYASGLGPVNDQPPSGVAAGANGSTLPRMVRPPQVTFGGQTASSIDYAGLAPGFVGLYQVNVHLPATVSTGSAVLVQITTAEGQKSNTVTIAVQ
jgi:uncharacterized protein (TIGR03437 family)